MGSDIKRRVIILGCVFVIAILFLLPSVFRQQFEGIDWLSKPISLGLDLKGGVHLVYQVELEEAVNGRLQTAGNAIRSDLRKQKVAVTRAKVGKSGTLDITLYSSKHVDKAKKAIADDYSDLEFVGQKMEGTRPVLSYGYDDAQANRIQKAAMSQVIETLRRRVDQFGVAEPLIQRVGTDRVTLQMPGVSDTASVKKIVGSVAKLEFRLVPAGSSTVGTITLKDTEGGSVTLEDEVRMGGDVVEDAQVAMFNTGIEVSLTFTSEGGTIFRKLTSDNVGRNLAIILDNVVYSSPEIREAISGGRASISGQFSLEEAKTLAVVLRSGALPAPLSILEERTVGPTLGQESIEKGVTAILIGFALVIVFMGLYYKKAGLIAVTILVLNILLVVAALSAFGATLTLPGMAGLALTIGMAVDANVIIFERIREELRNGSGRDAAVSAGFDKALSAIVDSNLTTLLAGLILYYFGTGPIRGFAVTLSIGIITTIFCATFVARLAFDVFDLKGGSKEVSI